MKISFPRSKTKRSPAEGWTRARAVLLLHLTLVIATSYLVLAQGELFHVDSVTAWLILGALVSTVPLFWLPRQSLESSTFSTSLVVADTIWIAAALASSGYVGVDLYVFYFLVLFLAAISESLALMSLGTVLVSVGYSIPCLQPRERRSPGARRL